MSWGIDFTTDIFLSRIQINSKEHLVDIIEEKEEDLKSIEALLKMYTSSNPKDIIPEDWKEESIMFLNLKLEELFSDQRELIETLKDLYYYKEYLENEKIKEL
ncbi:MAG: hypothetical protein PF569_08545 [Candidatus Woesearchaeota archaeon]|jgi:uncharacterized protein (DUF927 family)|nr:hypothetical protein [Candidatus Woesearchaeota archaeon]